MIEVREVNHYQSSGTNSEGYQDPTANKAIGHIHHEERVKQELDKDIHAVSGLIYTMRYVADLAGFEIVGRIHLRQKKTGRVFK